MARNALCPRWTDHKFWPKKWSRAGLYECKWCGQAALKSQVPETDRVEDVRE